MKTFIVYYRNRKGVVVSNKLERESFLEAARFATMYMFIGDEEEIILIRDTTFDGQHLDIQSGQ